ncbi:MAG: peptidase S10 [Luteolibacter sp.]
MFNPTKLLPIMFLLSASHPSWADEKTPEKESPSKKETAEAKPQDPVIKDGKVTIAGKTVSYKSTAGKMLIRDAEGKPQASIFYVSYEKDLVKDKSQRPVMFAFNGGPGSSSVWLHIGILGPRRIDFPGDGSVPVTPPARLIENESSILDVCDLVFIDPVSTGYSRAEKDGKARDFHGLNSDISSVGDFIRMWVTENGRWNSPKYLCGESYGGIRAAGLSDHLQSRYGMSLNGVVMLSSLLDFRTLIPAQGSQLALQVFLPSYTTTALHHGKIQGDRAELLRASRDFAFGEYGTALLKGRDLPDQEMKTIAAKLAELTGISAETWIKNKLRVGPEQFRAELLRAEGKVIGRFDARVSWDSTNEQSQYAGYDPSYSLAYGAFSTAMLAYLGDDLGWKEDQPYEILTGKVSPWDFGSDNRVVNVTDRLMTAMRDNPRLRVLVMGAHTDLATPPESIAYSLRQETDLPDSFMDRVKYTEYDAGHMFYVNPPDILKARADLLEFLSQ